MSDREETVVHLLPARAKSGPDHGVYRFLSENGKSLASLTYAKLEARAQIGADALARIGSLGGRVVLAYPAGLSWGRHLKHLIIIREQSVYPQGVEEIVERAHRAFRRGCPAPFVLQGKRGEQLWTGNAKSRRRPSTFWSRTAGSSLEPRTRKGSICGSDWKTFALDTPTPYGSYAGEA